MSQRQAVRMPWARPPGRYVPAARSPVRMRAADGNMPRTPKEIQQYCRKALRSELLQDKFDIMRACLLVALEEEAALSVHQSIIFENLRAQGEDVSEAVASINSKMSSAVRSQFNTARIDSLADLVLHAFVQALDLPLQNDSSSRSFQRDQSVTSPPVQPSDETAAASTVSESPEQPNRPESLNTPEATTRPSSDALQSGDQDTHDSQKSSLESDSGPSASAHPMEDISNSNDFTIAESASEEDISDFYSSLDAHSDSGAESVEDDTEHGMPLTGGVRHGVLPGYPPGGDPGYPPGGDLLGGLPEGLRPLQRPQRVRHLAEHPALQPLLKSHTALFLHVASDVLFNLQGYRQPLKEGKKRANMDAFLMNSVLESGVGAPIVLAILFRAVCHRAGVRVNLSVLDGGSDCVVWPEGSTGESGIKVSGHTLVLDIFSRGAVMLETEVKDFFNVESLSPSSDRDLLFALLSGLQDCNWRLALDRKDVWSRHSVAQCLQAALQPVTAVKEPYHLSRAVAAAERCLLVKPRHLELHVYAAALCFLDQNLHRCQQHLQLVYGGLDALGMKCATGYMDRTSSSNDEECDSDDSDDLQPYNVDREGDSNSRTRLLKGRNNPHSVFAVRRNVSIEDVCLLQRPRWQGGVPRPGSHAAHMQETLASMGVQIGASGGGFGVPEVRVVKRGSSRKVHKGNEADTSSAQEGEEVVAKLRESEVVLRRPRRCGVTPSGSEAAKGSVKVVSSDSGAGVGNRNRNERAGAAAVAASGAAASGSNEISNNDASSLEQKAVEFALAAEGGDGDVWEWYAGSDGELVFVTSSGDQVTLSLTDQAPLPLDESIMGEVTEDMGVLWHKTVLMQQMGAESSGEY